MHKKEQVKKMLLEQKLLPLFYHEREETSISILQALYNAGVRVVEYTNRGEAALKNFTALRKIADKKFPGLMLGIGTIISRRQAKNFADAGADFIVCPSINEEVGEYAAKKGLFWIPGCMTPTEIATALNAGAEIVKIFPGSLLGPSYISAVRDIFPSLQCVVTGGVEATEENLKNWFRAGVVGVGMGSKLITRKIVEEEDYDGLRDSTATALELVRLASGM